MIPRNLSEQEKIKLKTQWLRIKEKAETTQQFGMLRKAKLELEAIDSALTEK